MFIVLQVDVDERGNEGQVRLYPFSVRTRKEAEEVAAKAAQTFRKSGRDSRHGFWWGQGSTGEMLRFYVEKR